MLTTKLNNNNLTFVKSKVSYSTWFSNIYDFIFFPVLYSIRRQVMDGLRLLKANSVIDMCCGTGNQIKYLKHLGIPKLIGIDISENMLAKTSKNGVSELCYMQDATKTNFTNEIFDVAILSFILHETDKETAKQILEEAKRIVSKNGYIIIIDYHFNTKNNFIGRAGAFIVEAFIGGNHFKNYKLFIKHKLLKIFISDLEIINEKKAVFNAVSIFTLKNK